MGIALCAWLALSTGTCLELSLSNKHLAAEEITFDRSRQTLSADKEVLTTKKVSVHPRANAKLLLSPGWCQISLLTSERVNVMSHIRLTPLTLALGGNESIFTWMAISLRYSTNLDAHPSTHSSYSRLQQFRKQTISEAATMGVLGSWLPTFWQCGVYLYMDPPLFTAIVTVAAACKQAM